MILKWHIFSRLPNFPELKTWLKSCEWVVVAYRQPPGHVLTSDLVNRSHNCVSYFNAAPLGIYWAAIVSLGYSIQIYLILTLHCIASLFHHDILTQQSVMININTTDWKVYGIQFPRSRIRKCIEVRNSHSEDSLDKLNFHYHTSPKSHPAILLVVQPS